MNSGALIITGSVLLFAGFLALFAGISSYYDWQKAVKEWNPKTFLQSLPSDVSLIAPPQPPPYENYITLQIGAGIILDILGGLLLATGLRKMVLETKPRVQYPIFSAGVLLR